MDTIVVIYLLNGKFLQPFNLCLQGAYCFRALVERKRRNSKHFSHYYIQFQDLKILYGLFPSDLTTVHLCLSLLATLLPMVNVILCVAAVNTVTYGQRSYVCPCWQHCYLWLTFFCLSLLSTLLPMANVLLSVPAVNIVTNG